MLFIFNYTIFNYLKKGQLSANRRAGAFGLALFGPALR